MPLRLALGVRGTVAGHRLEGGGGGSLPSNASLGMGCARLLNIPNQQHRCCTAALQSLCRACAERAHGDGKAHVAVPNKQENQWAGVTMQWLIAHAGVPFGCQTAMPLSAARFISFALR